MADMSQELDMYLDLDIGSAERENAFCKERRDGVDHRWWPASEGTTVALPTTTAPNDPA